MTGGLVQGLLLQATVFGAQGIRGAALHLFQGRVEMPPELVRLTQTYESAQRPLAIGRSRVQQDARHRTIAVFRRKRIDAFANTGGGITTFQRELSHQGVGKRVQQDIAQPRISHFWKRNAPGFPPLGMRFVKSAVVFPLRFPGQPALHGLLAKLDEDALTPHFGSRNSHRSLAGQGRASHLRQFGDISEISRRFNACEANQCAHFAQAFDQHHLLE